MDILVTLNENYIPQLQVMLTSLWLNNPGRETRIWLLHSALSPQTVESLAALCARHGSSLYEVRADQSLFAGAPASKQYPAEMYYRLMAGRLLPESLKRVLYLDPDILIINSLAPLWDTDLGGKNLRCLRPHRQDRDCKRHQPPAPGHGQILQLRRPAHRSGASPGKDPA